MVRSLLARGGALAGIACVASGLFFSAQASATFLGSNGRIAFARSAANGDQHIFVVIPNGRDPRQVTSGKTFDSTPSWGPGGHVFVFSRRGATGGLDIFAARANGSGLTQITNGPQGIANSEPAWGPDGRSIAFTRGQLSGAAPSDVYRVGTDGKGLTRLTDSSAGDHSPAWSNGLIAYAQGEPPRSSIWTMRPDGSHKRRLTGVSSGAEHPDFSPTGSMIVFDRQFTDGGSAIYVMDRNGRHLHRVTDSRGIHEDPVFSPDGTLIAFAAGPSSRLALYTITVAGKKQTRVTAATNSSFGPSWQPVLIAPV